MSIAGLHSRIAVKSQSLCSAPKLTCIRRAALVMVLAVTWCIALQSGQVFGQERDYTKNTADATLRSQARIDPSSLGMGLQISLGEYSGRGGSSLPIVLNYSSKVWGINFLDVVTDQYDRRLYDNLDAAYGQYSVAGWTSSLDAPTLEWGYEERYSNSGVAGKCGPGTGSPHCYYVSRLHVRMPGGGTHELRKDDVPRDTVDPNGNTGYDYTGTFYSVDGARLRFETASNTLFFPDGSRYNFTARSSGTRQRATEHIDRNGNILKYDAAARSWEDTLGRQIKKPLPVNSALGGENSYGYNPDFPSAGDYPYTLPGVGGTTIGYTLRYRRMSEVLTDTSQPLGYRGDVSCGRYLEPRDPVVPALFQSGGLLKICSEPVVFNPVVLHEIVLPNNSSYKLTYNTYGEIDKIVYPAGGYERFRYDKISNLAAVMHAVYGRGNRGVVERWVSSDGTPAAEANSHWTYAATLDGQNLVYKVATTEPDSTYNERFIDP